MPITRLFKTLLLARCFVRGSGYAYAPPKCMLSRITSSARRVQPAISRCSKKKTAAVHYPHTAAIQATSSILRVGGSSARYEANLSLKWGRRFFLVFRSHEISFFTQHTRPRLDAWRLGRCLCLGVVATHGSRPEHRYTPPTLTLAHTQLFSVFLFQPL